MQNTHSKRRTGRYGNRRPQKRMLRVIVPVLLLLAIGTGTVLYAQQNSQPKYERYQFDANAVLGSLPNMTEDELHNRLVQAVEEGMFNISIASSITFETPGAMGEARIENVSANRYLMQVDIHLDETGELVYASGLLQPGYSIPEIQLSKKLAPGQYAATATFSAITPEELQLLGQAGASISLRVMDGSGQAP